MLRVARVKARGQNRRFTEPVVWGLIGETPLVPLDLGGELGEARVYLKAEWLNPGGSVKDRPAREILRAGLVEEVLPGRRLLDASSGNTAIAYAMLGAAAGIGVTVCVPTNVSAERMALLAAYGAEVIETDPLEGSDGAIRRARELAENGRKHFWYADQYSHPANPAAHYRTTGPEVWRDTGGRVTHFVAGVGTSGTLMGVGRYLKERGQEIRLVAVEPEGPFHGLEGLKHMATAIVPPLYDPRSLDETVRVSTERADAKARWLARARGVLVGWSTGAALAAAEEVIRRANRAARRQMVVVVIAPDGGQRYLSERRRIMGDS
jgi:cysteine synthase B